MKLSGKYYILSYAIICLLFFTIQRQNDLYNSQVSGFLPAGYESELTLDRDTANPIPVQEIACCAPGHMRVIPSLRTFPQPGKAHYANLLRNLSAMAKSGKAMNPFSTILYQRSLEESLSSLNEGHYKLISLGKLVI